MTYRGLEVAATGDDTVTMKAEGLELFTQTGEPLYIGATNLTATIDIDRETSPYSPNSWMDVVVWNGGKKPALAIVPKEGPLPKAATHSARVATVRLGAGRRLWRTRQQGNEVAIISGPDISITIAQSCGIYSDISPELAAFGVDELVPPTAFAVQVTAITNYRWRRPYGQIIVAPSMSYSGTDNGPLGKFGRVPPIWVASYRLPGTSYDPTPEARTAWITLEERNLYNAFGGSGAAVLINGWRDNL